MPPCWFLVLANLLLWLAQSDLFQAKWSSDIHDEWIKGRRKRYNIDVLVSEKRRAVMDEKFADALVTGYEELIDSLRNDPKDRTCWSPPSNAEQMQ